jgi:uncharacterized protein with von Willebrand factor type A (vWA) domain
MAYRNSVKAVETQISEASEKGYSEYSDFLGDIHARLLSGDTLTENENQGLDIYRGLHKVATEIKEWSGLVERTKGSSFFSKLGTKAMADGLGERLPEISPEVSDLADLERAKALLEDQLESNPENEDLINTIQEITDQIDASKTALDEGVEALQGASSSLRSGLKKSCQAAMEEISNIEKAGRGCGLESGQTIDQREAGLQSISEALKKTPDLQKILELAGRFDSLRRATQNAQTQYARSEVVGIEQGSDISRLLIPELIKMDISPELFAADFYEGRCLQYRLEGKEKKGAGPIIVLVDNSGSMTGDRTTWAKAIALALMQQAQAERRPFCLALYETQIVKSVSFEKGENMDLGKLLNILAYAPDGGTNIAPAIDWAFSCISEQKDADVIIISDGDDSSIRNTDWTKKVQSQATELKTRIFGILIEENNSKIVAQFKAFTSECILINDLRKQAQQAAVDIFTKTIKK